MSIIDCHLHLNPELDILAQFAEGVVDCSQKGLESEMRQNDVVKAVAIGIDGALKGTQPNVTPINPVSANKDIIKVIGINPYDSDERAVKRVRSMCQDNHTQGIKIYLGYFPHFPDDEAYIPFYKIALEHALPVVFHTGYVAPDKQGGEDIIPDSAIPGLVSLVLNKFPKLKVVIAHFGNPFYEQVSMILNNHSNVWADLSGLEIGKNPKLSQKDMEHITSVLDKTDKSKLVYGSDWPLSPMDKYISLVKRIIPEKFHEMIFYENALNVFNFK